MNRIEIRVEFGEEEKKLLWETTIDGNKCEFCLENNMICYIPTNSANNALGKLYFFDESSLIPSVYLKPAIFTYDFYGISVDDSDENNLNSLEIAIKWIFFFSIEYRKIDDFSIKCTDGLEFFDYVDE